MIELRRKIELAAAHPVWGPVVIVALAILMALVFIHVAQDDSGIVADIGAICFGVVTMLAAVLRNRVQLETPSFVAGFTEARGPPILLRAELTFSERAAGFVLPLRR